MKNLFQLIQFSDSAFPVGTFTFSNGLETAAQHGIVHDRSTLKSYTETIMYQSAFTDGVAALLAFRKALQNDYAGIVKVDQEIFIFRMNEEARIMITRMGKKLAELGTRLFSDDTIIKRWLQDINNDSTPGTYPVAQALLFAQAGLKEQDLFVSQQYGALNMILSAALRCVRVSHYDTQQILFELGNRIDEIYEIAREMDFENMNCFVPQMDILASLHEKGNMRMFMN